MAKYLIKLAPEGEEIGVHNLKRAVVLSGGRTFIARKIYRRRRLGAWFKYPVTVEGCVCRQRREKKNDVPATSP